MRWVATPRFHHGHHAADAEARDKNFAVHLPCIDALFRTRYLPRDAWPARYGLDGESGPRGFWRQLLLRDGGSRA